MKKIEVNTTDQVLSHLIINHANKLLFQTHAIHLLFNRIAEYILRKQLFLRNLDFSSLDLLNQVMRIRSINSTPNRLSSSKYLFDDSLEFPGQKIRSSIQSNNLVAIL